MCSGRIPDEVFPRSEGGNLAPEQRQSPRRVSGVPRCYLRNDHHVLLIRVAVDDRLHRRSSTIVNELANFNKKI